MCRIAPYVCLTSFVIAGLLVLISAIPASAQANLTIDSANVVLLAGTHITGLGNITLENNATIDNSSTILITGDWINNAGSPGLIHQSPGTVILAGNAQEISGTYTTDFYNLYLTGSGLKSLLVNINVWDTLALNDRQMATGAYTLTMLGADTGFITRSTGYISSDIGGSLERRMVNTGNYLFPVGSPLTYKYRPVNIQGGTASAQTFGVTMVDNDPSLDGLSTSALDTLLCSVNAKFYHRINHVNGDSAVNITIGYDTVADGFFQAIGHWGDTSWNNTGSNYTSALLSSLNGITAPVWNNFNSQAFALATTKQTPVISALGRLPICANDSVQLTSTSGFQKYHWSTGDTARTITVNEAGNYEVTVSTGICSASSDRLFVSVFPVPAASIIANGDTLASFGAVSYQWYLNNNPITGASSDTWIATQSGNYQVLITDTNGCSAISNVVSVEVMGISDLRGSGIIKTFPNPASDLLNVNITSFANEKLSLFLFNVLGQEVSKILPVNGNSTIVVPAAGLPPGTYILQLLSDNGFLYKDKVIISK